MKVDITKYEANKAAIQRWYRSKGQGNLVDFIPMVSCSTMVPCIVVAFYLAEIIGFTPDMISYIQSLIAFYGYTQIVGKPDNCPI